MNVVILSMRRCGVSWVFEAISQVHERLFGKPLPIDYEKERAIVSHNLLEGYTGVYDLDPKVLLDLGYDKILIIKRDLETMKEKHAHYQGYMEKYGSLEQMKIERPAFFERIELQYNLIYNQKLNDKRILIVNLEDLNNYIYSSFNEIIEFLEFKLSFIQKIKLFIRILRNKIKPFIVPINPSERNWNIYSAMLPKGQELCQRLLYLKKIEVEVKN